MLHPKSTRLVDLLFKMAKQKEKEDESCSIILLSNGSDAMDLTDLSPLSPAIGNYNFSQDLDLYAKTEANSDSALAVGIFSTCTVALILACIE